MKNSSIQLIQSNLDGMACSPVKQKDHKEDTLLSYHLLRVSDNLMNFFCQSFNLAYFYLIVIPDFRLFIFFYSDDI